MSTTSGYKQPLVSVVIPIRNEEKYIEKCLLSLLEQDFPKDNMEIIFIDGCSDDKTLEILDTYIKKYPGLIQVLENTNKTVPYGMNIGIRASVGQFIIRMDAHSEYAKDYITQCVHYLQTTDADNVGGMAETKSKGYIGEAIALMLSSPFGVGNSNFRINGKDGYVDTVPFGAFRREVFDKYGYYDERLTRNQDNEMNHRIRKNGGKIYLSKDIQLTYYSRDTIKGIGKMGFQNGCWNIITYYLCPGAMSVRHFIPLIFVLSIVVGSVVMNFINIPLLKGLFIVETILYIVLNIMFSLKLAMKAGFKYWGTLVFLFPFFHIVYGLGSIQGIKKVITKKY